MQPLIDFLLQLGKKSWTGQIIIDVHQGKATKVSKREQVKL